MEISYITIWLNTSDTVSIQYSKEIVAILDSILAGEFTGPFVVLPFACNPESEFRCREHIIVAYNIGTLELLHGHKVFSDKIDKLVNPFE